MKSHLLVVAWIAVTASVAISQSRLDLSADYALFRGTGNLSHLEVYYSFPQSQLTFVSDSSRGGMVASALVLMRMFRGDEIEMNQAWKLESRVANTSQIDTRKYLLDQRRIDIEQGKYKLFVYATDVNNPEKRDSSLIEFEVPTWREDLVRISGIELCSSLKRSEPDSMNVFYKNSFEAIPQPEKAFGKEFPILFYYLEVYNVNSMPLSGSYVTRTYVTDRSGSKVEAVKEKVRKHGKGLDSFVDVGSVNIISLTSGAYFLNYALTDTLGNTISTATKKFFVYGTPPPLSRRTVASGEVLATRFAAMSEGELDQEFEQVRYLSSDFERRTYEASKDLKGKRDFLFRFWGERDPDPSTDENELYTQHRERLEIVKNKFQTFYKPGWRTDRGRVFLQYGPADEVERFPSSENTKPYEVWHYNSLQGGVFFVFGDRTNFGDYVLLHSTARGEVNDPDWLLQIRGF